MNSLEKLLAGGINLPFCFIEGDGGAGAGGGGAAAGTGGDGGAGAGAGTGAGTGTGSEGGGTPVVSTPEINPADNPREFLRDAVSKVKIDSETGQRVEEKIQTPEEKAAADAAKAEVDKAAALKAGEAQPEPKTEEELEAEKLKADAEQAEKDKQSQTPPDPLDKGGPVPAEKLAEALKANPELGAALEKAGIDKDALFQTSRDAALTGQFLEHFPTPEAAKFGRESAEHFYDIEESFPKIQSTEDLDKFITGTMLPLSFVYDPATGKPVMNADGKTFKTDGSVARFVNLMGDFDQNVSKGLADSLIQQGIRAGGEQGDQIKEYGERLKSALDVIGEFRAAGYKMPTAKGQAAELSPEQKAEFDRLRKLEQETTAGKSKEQEAQTTGFEENLFKDATEDSEKFLRATIDATSLTENERKHAIADIYEEVGKRMESDRTFKQLKQQLWNQGLNDKTRAEIRALNKRTFTVYAAKVMDKVLADAGAKRIQANAERQTKIDAQIDKSKMHQTTGTSTGSSAGRVPSGDDLHEKAVTELTKELGRAPKEGEYFTRILELKGIRQKSA